MTALLMLIPLSVLGAVGLFLLASLEPQAVRREVRK